MLVPAEQPHPRRVSACTQGTLRLALMRICFVRFASCVQYGGCNCPGLAWALWSDYLCVDGRAAISVSTRGWPGTSMMSHKRSRSRCGPPLRGRLSRGAGFSCRDLTARSPSEARDCNCVANAGKQARWGWCSALRHSSPGPRPLDKRLSPRPLPHHSPF